MFCKLASIKAWLILYSIKWNLATKELKLRSLLNTNIKNNTNFWIKHHKTLGNIKFLINYGIIFSMQLLIRKDFTFKKKHPF